MKQEKLTDPYDIGWRDGYEACKVENNLPSRKTVLDNKDLREVIDKSYDAGYEEAKKISYNEAYAEAKKLFENSIFGKIDQFWIPTGVNERSERTWRQTISLIYEHKDLEDLVFKKMGLCPGDKVMITITKQ